MFRNNSFVHCYMLVKMQKQKSKNNLDGVQYQDYADFTKCQQILKDSKKKKRISFLFLLILFVVEQKNKHNSSNNLFNE